MRLVIILMFMGLTHVSAKGYAQQVTLSVKHSALQDVFKIISRQADVSILYDAADLKQASKVTITAVNMPLKQILAECLKDQPLQFIMKGNIIQIIRKNRPAVQKPSFNPMADSADIIVHGHVVNAAGVPLSGVSVQVQHAQRGTQTDEAGRFMISVNKGTVLILSSVGYVTRQVVCRVAEMEIVMEEQVSELDDIVVTGYGTQQRRAITGSVSSIKSKDIASMPVLSFDAAMQGKMAGVQVQSKSGLPGGAIKIEVRGQGSITAGTDPLYIVDGVPMNAENTSSVVSSNPLAVINPSDIESIEVLKDAAAASAYGAQAGNGVVLITTKKGKTGATKFDLSIESGIVKPTYLMKLMNTQQYLGARIESYMNANPTWDYERAKQQVLSLSRLPATLTDEDIAALPTYDWNKAVYQTAHTSKINFSAAGGSDKTKYRISGSYENAEGSIVASDFKRGTVNMFLSSDLSKRISFSTNINLTSIRQDGPSGSAGASTLFSSPAYAGPMMLPFIPIYNEDGSLNYDYNGFPGIFTQNPIHTSLLNDQVDKTAGLLANLQIQYRIIDGLVYKTNVGIDYRNINGRRYVDPRTQEGYIKKGILNTYEQTPRSIINTHTLNYRHTFQEQHQLDVLLGGEYRSFERENTSVSGEGFPNHEFREMQSAALITGASGSWTGVKRLGTFLQANYFGLQRYMLSAILRYDGSSRFGKNKMFGWFPAVSAGWDLAQEEFLKKSDWVQQLKLRAGYGETGNDQIDNFTSRSLFGGGITYDNQAGIQPNSLGNAELHWERNVTVNLGLDFSLFERRVYGSVEVYKRTSKDLLLSQPVPWTSGYEEIYNNVGEVVNKGLELELGLHIIKTKNFNWTSNFNISFLDNKVTKLYDTLRELPGDPSVRVGYSLKTNFYPQYAGVNSATGRPLFYDNNGNISYNPPATTADAYTPYGRGNQLSGYYGGFTNTFTYKGFELGVFFQYDIGRELYNNQSRNMARKGDMNINGIAWYYDNRWTTPGQITSVPRPINNAAEVNSARGDLASTRWLEDASYIRLKTINLSYQLPQSVSGKVGMDGISVFAQCLNVYTWTKWTGYDPEFYLDGGDFGSYTGLIPPVKSFRVGLNLKF